MEQPPNHCSSLVSGTNTAQYMPSITRNDKPIATHGLRYPSLIGDGDSSDYHSVVTGVPSYGRDITKVECANHAVKCYRNRLEALCNEKSDYRGKHGLSPAMMKRITHGARCAIKMHSVTGDIAALRHDLRNGPRYYFGIHNDCNSAFFQQKSNLSGKYS